MAEHTIDHDGIRLAVADDGEGPPIVLLHGLTATRRYVVMGSRTLERSGHRQVAYDARGHGASSPAPDPAAYRYPDLAGDLAAVLDRLGIERATLAGASMGAHTIAAFAIAHPERVAAACLITPAFLPGGSGPGPAAQPWDALADGLERGGIDGFVGAYPLEQMPEAWRATVEKVVRQRLGQHEHLDAIVAALRAVPPSHPFEDLAELAVFGAVPTAVVASRDEADPGHPLAVGEAWAAAIPGARLLTEEPGKSPLAWQGGQLSRVIGELANAAATR